MKGAATSGVTKAMQTNLFIFNSQKIGRIFSETINLIFWKKMCDVCSKITKCCSSGVEWCNTCKCPRWTSAAVSASTSKCCWSPGAAGATLPALDVLQVPERLCAGYAVSPLFAIWPFCSRTTLESLLPEGQFSPLTFLARTRQDNVSFRILEFRRERYFCRRTCRTKFTFLETVYLVVRERGPISLQLPLQPEPCLIVVGPYTWAGVGVVAGVGLVRVDAVEVGHWNKTEQTN